MKSLALAVGLALCACRGSSTSAGDPTASSEQVEHRPIVALAIWPEHWASIVGSAQKLEPLRGNPMLVGSTMWSALAQLGAAAGFGGLTLPPPGVDPNAPISFELFSAGQSFEATALSAARATSAGKPYEPSPALRLRITIQARDPKAASEALRTALGSQPGASVVVGASAVAVDIALGGTHPAPFADVAPPTAPSSAFEADGASAARLIAHFDRVSEIATTIGMAHVVDALPEMPSDQKLLLLAAGTAELFTAYLFVDPATAFATDLMVEVPAEPGAPHIAFALGDAGKATMTAAGLARGKSSPLTGLHWAEALSATPRSPFLAATLRTSEKRMASDLATLVHECGAVCIVYAGLGNGFQLASWLHIDLDEVFAGASNNLGVDMTVLRGLAATWSDNDLMFFHAEGAKLPAWKRPATRPPIAAEACYRQAATAVRAALKSSDVPTAKAALDKAAPCVEHDPAIAARFKATSELVTAVAKP